VVQHKAMMAVAFKGRGAARQGSEQKQQRSPATAVFATLICSSMRPLSPAAASASATASFRADSGGWGDWLAVGWRRVCALL
jgi:hypothetical protein